MFGRTTTAIPGVDPRRARELQGQGAVLVDVREPMEFVAGHAADATHVPLAQLPGRLDELPRDRQVVAVCQSGNRSARAAQLLQRAGYDVVNLDGGMVAWRQAGLPVRTGS